MMPTRLLILSLLLTAGCMTPHYVPTTRYALSPTIPKMEAAHTDKVLAVRPLDPARPYGQPVVTRDAGDRLGQLEHVEWAEQPRDTVTRALMDGLIAAHRFADVGLAQDVNQPGMILNGQLRKFDLVRTAKKWTAVCEIRLELREAAGSGLLYGETLVESEPLAKNDPEALPAAMNAALSRIVETAVKGITAK